jgi:hypothetical protein
MSGIKMINVNRKINKIGLDYDGKGKKHNEFVEKMSSKACEYGIIQTKKTKNGHHVKIDLFHSRTLKESLWIRLYLNDDPMRLLFDCMRIISDIDNLDVLWDIKKKFQIQDLIIS